jgi:hypothetical protein
MLATSDRQLHHPIRSVRNNVQNENIVLHIATRMTFYDTRTSRRNIARLPDFFPKVMPDDAR